MTQAGTVRQQCSELGLRDLFLGEVCVLKQEILDIRQHGRREWLGLHGVEMDQAGEEIDVQVRDQLWHGVAQHLVEMGEGSPAHIVVGGELEGVGEKVDDLEDVDGVVELDGGE